MSTKDSVHIDPMLLEKKKRKKESRKRKIERTGLKKATCKTCNKTRDIAHFDVTPNRSRTVWKPRITCIKCANKKRKSSKKGRKRSYTEDPNVRKWGKNSSDKARRLISDAYIRRMYSKFGYKAKDVTPEMIVTKRQEIIKKRESAANETSKKKIKDGTYGRGERERMTDGYIRSLIRQSTLYNGEEITDKMVHERREKLIERRKVMELNKIKKKQKERIVKEKQTGYIFYVPKELRD